MIKYYKADVTLTQTVTVSVAAASEDEARRKAREAAERQVQGAQASKVELNLQGEASVQVGSKVKHFLFGEGEILNLVQTTNANKDFGLRATVQFADGETKDIHLPMAQDKLEILA